MRTDRTAHVRRLWPALSRSGLVWAATDGQVLVLHELLGIYDGHAARFVKRYADVRDEMIKGVKAFTEEVRTRRYPEPEHGYTMAPDEIERLQELMAEGTGEPFTGGFTL